MTCQAHQSYQDTCSKCVEEKFKVDLLKSSLANPRVDFDYGYQMYRKYGPLSVSETIQEYLDARKQKQQSLQDIIEAQRVELEKEIQRQDDFFFDWCTKYKKEVTPERVKALTPFL